MTVLNTVVAAQLKAFKISVDALIAKGVKKDEAILRTIRDLIAKSKPVRFEDEKRVTKGRALDSTSLAAS